MHIFNLFFIAITSLLLRNTSGQLTAELVGTKLPAPLANPAIFYDGDDSIFVFGGHYQQSDEILRFSISSESISLAGRLPHTVQGDSVQSSPEGTLFYFDHSDATVYRFDPQLGGVAEEMGRIPPSESSVESVMYNSTSAIIIGGPLSGLKWIVRFEMTEPRLTQVAVLPTNPNAVNVVRGSDNSAYIYGYQDRIMKLDLSTFATTVAVENFPAGINKASGVFDGKYIYHLGDSVNQDTIVRFDPEAVEHDVLSVNNFPIDTDNSQYMLTPRSVYVEKLNRIYYFGGSVGIDGVSEDLDRIWYIDLSPPSSSSSTSTTPEVPETEETLSTTESSSSSTEMTTEISSTTIITTVVTDISTGITDVTEPPTSTINPDIFTCDGRPDGMYPNPYDCAMFIGCHNGATEFYTCPSPLLFDPSKLVCDFPENVRCDLSCESKPNGMYPHPQDCSLFIGCHDGITEVYKCPPPLLFNPPASKCDFPELVECFL